MTRRKWLLLVACVSVVLLSGGIGLTRASFVDVETSSSNDIQAWTSAVWTQTSQTDFEAGVSIEVDTATSPGDVMLGQQGGFYLDSGSLASQVLDIGISGARWDGLFWDGTFPAGTAVTFEARAGDTAFTANDTSPDWLAFGANSPVTVGLPDGRYMQWRATLSTSDNSTTPILSEVGIYHY